MIILDLDEGRWHGETKKERTKSRNDEDKRKILFK